jgi:hypothetical protein
VCVDKNPRGFLSTLFCRKYVLYFRKFHSVNVTYAFIKPYTYLITAAQDCPTSRNRVSSIRRVLRATARWVKAAAGQRQQCGPAPIEGASPLSVR